MSRLDRDFEGDEEAKLDLAELFAAFASGPGNDTRRRQAMACFLSASAGWRDAANTLGGTFAGQAPGGTELKPGKES